MHLDLFCQVVDNFGDAGVCWRLARQLVAEHGIGVRLWIDDPASLARLWPEVDPGLARQSVAGVEIRRWDVDFLAPEPHEVVIEAFGCRLPPEFVAAMAARARAPLWINLEYLSAEAWVEGCHALPSPQARVALTKHFFFPGFSARTGGLLREARLTQSRQAFAAAARDDFLRRLGVAIPQTGRRPLTVSLFCYDNPCLPELVAAWSSGSDEVLCLLPQGARPGVLATTGVEDRVGSESVRGRLRVRTIPFLDQDSYDRLLWSCDLNFVRGEDSFLRAQWAARPFVWQAYPQSEEAHHAKLDAFLDSYLAGVAGGPAGAARALFEAWNGMRDFADSWSGFVGQFGALQAHAIDWDRRLSALKSLAENLAYFCDSKLKSRV